MPMTLTIPFCLGDHVYIINEIWNRKDKKYEWNIAEGIVESVHIGRKLKYNKCVTDTYIKCRSTMVNALFAPIPLEKATKYVYSDRRDAEERVDFWKRLQEDGNYV